MLPSTEVVKNCPSEFRPVYFKRYVDDCFIIFRDRSHIDQFLTYLNGQHPKIKFTKEIEKDGYLPFLDVNVRRVNHQLETSVFRKPSFTGLGPSFFSFIPSCVRKAVLHSAVIRAFRISSNYQLLHTELNFLKSFFLNKGYPKQLIESVIRHVLDKVFSPRVPTAMAPKKLEKYFVLPYFGNKSISLQNDIISLLSQFYPYLNPKIVLRNRFSIASLFRFKDRIPKCSRSGIVYEFRCSSCEESYIGSTYVRLHTRVCEHKGISDRTGRMLTSPTHSSIRQHSHSCDTPFSIDNFKIIDSDITGLRILESLYIHKKKPKLNGNCSSYPLCVVR